MTEREPDQPLNHAAWAKLIEQRLREMNGQTNSHSPTLTGDTGNPAAPETINDSLIEDLELNAMLDQLSEVDYAADTFVEKVFSRIEAEQVRAATQNRWKTKGDQIKPFDVLEFDVIPSDTFNQTIRADIGAEVEVEVEYVDEEDAVEPPDNLGRKSLLDLAVSPPAKSCNRAGEKLNSGSTGQASPSTAPIKKRAFLPPYRLIVAIAAVLFVGATFGIAYFLAGAHNSSNITKKGSDSDISLNIELTSSADSNQKDLVAVDKNPLSETTDIENTHDVTREHDNVQPIERVVENERRHQNLRDKNAIPESIQIDRSENRPPKWVASIRSESDTLWKTRPADDFTTDLLELQKGSIELMSPNGAQLTITGPAVFNFASKNELQLKLGNLSAFIPSTARGFSVLTPSATIVDNGRRFLVAVDANQTSRVFAEQGKIDVHTRPHDELAAKSWTQTTGQTSIITATGLPVQWLLSLQFDNRGFGHVEFNGRIMDEPVFTENADFVLRNIFKSVTPKILAAEKYSKQPMLAAIVVNSDIFLIPRAREMTAARLAAVKAINNLEIEPLDIRKYRSEHQRFMAAHKVLVRRSRADVENLARTNPRQIPQFRLPDNPAAIEFATHDQKDMVKSILNQTVLLLETRAGRLAGQQKTKTAGKQRKGGLNDASNPQHMFARMMSISGFGDFKIEGFLTGEQSRPLPSEKPLLQTMDEPTLQKYLWANVAEVDLFSDDKIAKQAIQYATNLNRHATKLRMQNLPQPETMDEPIKELLPKRPDLNGLPLAMGDDCILDKDDATALASVSNDLGPTLAQFNSFGSLPEGTFSFRDAMVSRAISHSIAKNKGDKSVPGLIQMLQADHPRVRYQLIKKLEAIGTDLAIETIAKRAIFDLNPEIRLAATESLKQFPPEKYRKVFIDGMRYPLPVIAEHSAEALVRLKDIDATDELAELIDLPSPNRPFKDKKGNLAMREVVGINHMRNCMLCHPPSNSLSDPVRGSMPTPGERLPQKYYQHSRGAFVRADVTYLRQDFSVVQPVPDPGPWPKLQRFDYVVRTRGLTANERKMYAETSEPKTYPQRDALLFTMRKLTGKKPKIDDANSWRTVLATLNRDKPKNEE